MNRMAIFVFYDFEGKVDGYVKYLLNSLKTIAKKIVIVSNGKLDIEGRKEFETFTEYIYERDNVGLDAGAYKDAFLYYLKNEEWEKWDEIIMLNDTFYGPVYPWQEVFTKMDHQDIDFWGMTKVEPFNWDGIIMPTHIQSYFIAVRKKMVISDVFNDFWQNMDYPQNLYDAVFNFEMKFADYFSRHNFKYLTYTDVMDNNYIVDKATSPFMTYTLELLTITRMPLVKRKALALDNFKNALDTISYIANYTEYDVNLIKAHMRRLDINRKLVPYGYMEIDDFCKKYPKVYIYGHGMYGNLVSAYFRWKNHNYEKFIVTTKEDSDGDDVISYDELKMDNQTGILLAVGKKNLNQILPILAKEIPETQLLVPRYY